MNYNLFHQDHGVVVVALVFRPATFQAFSQGMLNCNKHRESTHGNKHTLEIYRKGVGHQLSTIIIVMGTFWLRGVQTQDTGIEHINYNYIAMDGHYASLH